MTNKRKRLEALLLKLTKQEEDLSRKIDEVNAKIKEEKNTEITEMVDVFDLTPEELQEVLKKYKDGNANETSESAAALSKKSFTRAATEEVTEDLTEDLTEREDNIHAI